jgi:hypothetical protein
VEKWPRVFPHCGKFRPGGMKSFPHCGKKRLDFSTLWKKFRGFFHAMEKLCAIFPHNGKTLVKFSTLWKLFFHTVEKPAPAG